MADAVNTADAVAKDVGVPTVIGNSDHWQLMSKFIKSDQSLIVSTKGMEIEGVGVLVATYRKECGVVTESSAMVYGAKLAPDVNGGRKLVPIRKTFLRSLLGY